MLLPRTALQTAHSSFIHCVSVRHCNMSLCVIHQCATCHRACKAAVGSDFLACSDIRNASASLVQHTGQTLYLMWGVMISYQSFKVESALDLSQLSKEEVPCVLASRLSQDVSVKLKAMCRLDGLRIMMEFPKPKDDEEQAAENITERKQVSEH